MTKQPGLFGRDARSALPRDMQADFDALFAAYPRRAGAVARRPAEAAYRDLLARGVPAEDLLRAARAYAGLVEREKTPPLYVVSLKNFLGQGHYEAHLAREAAPATPAPIPAPDPADDDHDLAALRRHVGDAEWRTWIRRLSVVSHTVGESALVSAPTRFLADHVRAQFGPQIRAVLRVRSLTILAEQDIRP